MGNRLKIQPHTLGAFILAWVYLNAFINLDIPLRSQTPRQLLLPSLEVWALLLGLGWIARRGVTFTPRLYLPLMGLMILGRLFRLGDVIMPVYFNRPFNLYMDVGYLPGLAHLLVNSFSGRQLLWYGLATGALVAAAVLALWRSLRIAHRFFRNSSARSGFRGLTAAMALLVAADLFGPYPSGWRPPATTITPRLAAEAAFILNIRKIRREGLSAVRMATARIPNYEAPLSRLDGSDMYLFLIESYGETLFGHPEHWSRFKPVADRFAATLARGGYRVCSRFMASPTFGGASWLAFGTLESGVWLPDQMRYNFLVASNVPPLAEFFERAGYRTVSVMPGTTMPWPEGRYFGYQRDYHARDLDYRGPAFGWSPMPDQFVLDRIHRTEILNARQPLFIRYVLVSSHAPFHQQPRYLEDWDRIGDGSVFHEMDPVVFPNNWPDLTGAFGAYLTAIRYELTVLGQYLTRYIHDDALIIIMGDHQPNAHLTGPAAAPLVPVHVISRSEKHLAAFHSSGWTPGIIPRNHPTQMRLDAFLPDFLEGFSR
ncbi:MAG: sulfatase-like hydrolase/transferase [Desulfobacterales bacterium]